MKSWLPLLAGLALVGFAHASPEPSFSTAIQTPNAFGDMAEGPEGCGGCNLKLGLCYNGCLYAPDVAECYKSCRCAMCHDKDCAKPCHMDKYCKECGKTTGIEARNPDEKVQADDDDTNAGCGGCNLKLGLCYNGCLYAPDVAECYKSCRCAMCHDKDCAKPCHMDKYCKECDKKTGIESRNPTDEVSTSEPETGGLANSVRCKDEACQKKLGDCFNSCFNSPDRTKCYHECRYMMCHDEKCAKCMCNFVTAVEARDYHVNASAPKDCEVCHSKNWDCRLACNDYRVKQPKKCLRECNCMMCRDQNCFNTECGYEKSCKLCGQPTAVETRDEPQDNADVSYDCATCHVRNGQCTSGCPYAPDIGQCLKDCNCYMCKNPNCKNCGIGKNCNKCKKANAVEARAQDNVAAPDPFVCSDCHMKSSECRLACDENPDVDSTQCYKQCECEICQDKTCTANCGYAKNCKGCSKAVHPPLPQARNEDKIVTEAQVECFVCHLKAGQCRSGCRDDQCYRDCECMMCKDKDCHDQCSYNRGCDRMCNHKNARTIEARKPVAQSGVRPTNCVSCHLKSGQCRSGCRYAPDITQCYKECDCYMCKDKNCHDNCGYNKCDGCKNANALEEKRTPVDARPPPPLGRCPYHCNIKEGQCRTGCNVAPDINKCLHECKCWMCKDKDCHDKCPVHVCRDC